MELPVKHLVIFELNVTVIAMLNQIPTTRYFLFITVLGLNTAVKYIGAYLVKWKIFDNMQLHIWGIKPLKLYIGIQDFSSFFFFWARLYLVETPKPLIVQLTMQKSNKEGNFYCPEYSRLILTPEELFLRHKYIPFCWYPSLLDCRMICG